jgi:formamidopyrimidine-DNA glycosylase
MPELPEVETIKRGLEKTILGKKIVEVCVYNPAVIRQPSPVQFKKKLTGLSFKSILRKGKLLILELSDSRFLTIHLKMTGQLVYLGDPAKSRVSFRFSDGNILAFNDQRLFAELKIVDDWKELKFIQELGPEPFEINAEKFKSLLAAKKTKIKPLLLDQTFLSGIGNLYAAESLFRAGVHPARPAQSLTDQEKELLFKEIKAVLTEAIHYGGSSVDNYVRVTGKPGGYVPYLKVYDREGKPCLKCKTPVKRISLGGRGTYFCSRCQK